MNHFLSCANKFADFFNPIIVGRMDKDNLLAQKPLTKTAARRRESLFRTIQMVTVDRAATHGDAEDEMPRVAAVWNGLLKHKLKEPLTQFDVAALMVGLKMVRATANPLHLDNWDDGSGYSSIGAGLAAAVLETSG